MIFLKNMDLGFASDMSEKKRQLVGRHQWKDCMYRWSFIYHWIGSQTNMQKTSEVFFVKVPWIEELSKLLYKFEETGIQTAKTSSSLISQKSFGEVIFVGFKFPKFLDCMKSLSHHQLDLRVSGVQ